MLNRIDIMGRLTRDPELRYTQNQTAVVSFTLAVDRDGKDAGTDFIECIAWKGTAEFVQKFFTKGSMAVVSGRLQIRDWQDKDGNKRRSAEVVANSVYFGEKKAKDNLDAAMQRASAGGVSVQYEDPNGDLPFD